MRASASILDMAVDIESVGEKRSMLIEMANFIMGLCIWFFGKAHGLAQTNDKRVLHGARVVDHDVLQARELTHHFEAAATAVTASLGAAVRGHISRRAIGVDPDRARLNVACKTQGAVDVLGPYACGQAVFGIVGKRDEFLFRVERNHAHDRPENLLLHEAHLVASLRNDGWLEVPATR